VELPVVSIAIHVALAGLSSRGYMAEKGRTFYFNLHANLITFKHI